MSLNRSTKTIDRYIARGVLSTYKNGKLVLIKKSEIEGLSSVITSNDGTEVRITATGRKKQLKLNAKLLTPTQNNFRTQTFAQDQGLISKLLDKITEDTDIVNRIAKKADNDYGLHLTFLQSALTTRDIEIQESKKKTRVSSFQNW